MNGIDWPGVATVVAAATPITAWLGWLWRPRPGVDDGGEVG